MFELYLIKNLLYIKYVNIYIKSNIIIIYYFTIVRIIFIFFIKLVH